MSEDKSSKTEKATPQRRKKAREDGNIARTPDLSAWLTIICFATVAGISIGWLRELFVELSTLIPQVIVKPDTDKVTEALRVGGLGVLKCVAPILLTTMVVGSLGHIVQGGLKIHAKRFKPNWKKLNVFTGLKQMVGGHAAWTFAKTLLKFVVFGLIGYQVLRGAVDQLVGSGSWQLSALVLVAQDSAFSMMRTFAGVGLVIAAADYFMERRRVEKSMKMTKDEVRREHKQSEGDPHIKGAIRAKQREMGRRRMMAAVSEASVVMVNPTHIAVALKYEQGSGAPQVVAKGSGFLAERIRQEAEAHEVPVVRDVIVARMLFKLCEVDQYIPADLYDAIAQVLAFVFRLNERGTKGGEHDSPLRRYDPDEQLPEDLRDEAIGVRRSAA